MANEYCSAADVKAFTRTPLDDAVLAALLEPVSRAIDNYCRRFFYTVTGGREYDWESADEIRLRDDLVSLTSIVTSAGQTLTLTDVTLLPRSGPPYRSVRLRSSSNIWLNYSGYASDALVISGVWGYAAKVPADIVLAAKMWVADIYMSSDVRGLVSVGAGVLQAQLAQRLETPPVDALPFLRPHRRTRIGAI